MPVIGHGTEICTSTTRPSTAYEGMMIYETDTNKVLVNSSATSTPSWVEVNDLDNTAGLADNGAALSILGRSSNSVGERTDITATSDGHVLRRSGTGLGFGQIVTAGIADTQITTAKETARPSAGIVGTGNQTSAGSGGTAVVNLGSVQWDNDTMTSSAHRLTVKTAGYYVFEYKAQCENFAASNDQKLFTAFIRKNGGGRNWAQTVHYAATYSASVVTSPILAAGVVLNMNVNDYVELCVVQSGFSSVNITGNECTLTGAFTGRL